MKKLLLVCLVLVSVVAISSFQSETVQEEESIQQSKGSNKCLSCHDGIEPIKDPDSYMMEVIDGMAEDAGYAGNNCIVCHGGNPETTDGKRAHEGSIPYFMEND